MLTLVWSGAIHFCTLCTWNFLTNELNWDLGLRHCSTAYSTICNITYPYYPFSSLHLCINIYSNIQAAAVHLLYFSNKFPFWHKFHYSNQKKKRIHSINFDVIWFSYIHTTYYIPSVWKMRKDQNKQTSGSRPA